MNQVLGFKAHALSVCYPSLPLIRNEFGTFAEERLSFFMSSLIEFYGFSKDLPGCVKISGLIIPIFNNYIPNDRKNYFPFLKIFPFLKQLQ